MTQKTVAGETTYYFYNNQERLVRVEDTNNQVIAEYGYNSFGHRLWKEVNGEKTYFFYNASGLVGAYTGTGELIKEFQYSATSNWMTNPLFQRDGGIVYFYQNDHLGTPHRMVATTGEVVWSATYSAFGKTFPIVETVTNNLRFPGQYWDEETGLNHNYFRDYSPILGRYIQSDPIGILRDYNNPVMQILIRQGLPLGSSGSTLNHNYGYVEQNPLIYSDKFGNGPWAGGACAAYAGLKEIKGLKDLDDKIDEIRNTSVDLLNKINKRLSECEFGSEKYQNLLEIKRRIQKDVLDRLSDIAAENVTGPGEWLYIVGWSMVCSGLSGLPIP